MSFGGCRFGQPAPPPSDSSGKSLLALALGVPPVAAVDPVRIGIHSGVIETELAADEGSGHLLAVLRYDEPSQDCFTVHFSSDSGASWSQSYQKCSAHGLGDHVAAAIAHGSIVQLQQLGVEAAEESALLGCQFVIGHSFEFDPEGKEDVAGDQGQPEHRRFHRTW